MSQLLYSTANTSRQELAMIETPAPQGRYHAPYAFGDYMDDIEHALDHIGYSILRQEYEVPKDRQSFFGALEIAPNVLEGEYISKNESDYSLLVGVRGSHDQRIPRGMVLGSRVMVCSNLCFSGDIGSIKTKQTLNMRSRLPGLIREAMKQIPELAQRQDEKFQAFQAYTFDSPRHGDAALVEIYRRGGLTAAQLGKAIHEYDRPSYAEHAAFGPSVWRVFNAATEALKPTGGNTNHHTLAERTAITDRFLSDLVGVGFHNEND